MLGGSLSQKDLPSASEPGPGHYDSAIKHKIPSYKIVQSTPLNEK